MHDIEFMQVVQALEDLVHVKLDQWFWEDGYFAELAQRPALQILQYQIDFVVFDDCVFVAHDVLVAETFQHADFLFDGLDELLAEGDFLHRHQDAVVQVYAFVDLSKRAFPDLLDQLVILNGIVFRKIIHSK